MTPFDDDEEANTFFGIYSQKQLAEVVELLSSLGIRFEFVSEEVSEERLRDWTAWDESSARTQQGYFLHILNADLGKLGTKLVDRFPERTFRTE